VLQFFVEDDSQTSDKVQVHSFGENVGLVRATFVRLKFKVNLVLMASNPESVCFRFELIGCPSSM
jgi:hypothetical protein